MSPMLPSEYNMVSLITLLREPMTFELAYVRRALDSIFPGTFLPQNDDSFVIEGSNPLQLMVKSIVPSNSGIFFVNYVPGPYTEFPPSLRILPILGSRRVSEHRAWLSVDRIGEIGSDGDAFRSAG
jgi:hypothetical protein